MSSTYMGSFGDMWWCFHTMRLFVSLRRVSETSRMSAGLDTRQLFKFCCESSDTKWSDLSQVKPSSRLLWNLRHQETRRERTTDKFCVDESFFGHVNFFPKKKNFSVDFFPKPVNVMKSRNGKQLITLVFHAHFPVSHGCRVSCFLKN